MSQAEDDFEVLLKRAGMVEGMVREHRFHEPAEGEKKRQWRFDFAWPRLKVAAEIDGGNWSAGRHTRGRGYEEDCDKTNAAASQGWLVVHFTPSMVKRNHVGVLRTIATLLSARENGDV